MAETKTGSIVATPPVRFDIDSVSNPIHPEWFQGVFESQLGKQVGIGQFGVNYVTLVPGSYSALRHWHEGEDEFVFVLHGSLVLVDENGERVLNEGE